MIDWTQEVLPDRVVVARSLSDRDCGEGVDLRLIGLTPQATPRTISPPLTLTADYLLTVRATDPIAEQTGAMALMFAAMEHEETEVVAGRDALKLCADLGLPPGPGFVLRATVTIARRRPADRAPLVRFPLTIAAGELGVLQGSVLGPGDTPVAGAVVRVEGVDRTAQTDAFGRFRLHGPVGGKNKPVRLNVRARGVEIDSEVETDSPVILRLPLEI
ncbi:carboxypeptidase-like regulatory domain-containing protein [Caulobacter soli]|uniref:carboxypeptidase-like regulatory domain-containing protein n=1 Tax=Caulobacter soli TaxID=2708539 RepID=UPI001FE41077|nr:carboxypeptidase-like regulatory domain-containing protein [Caulobacter soli]